MTSNPQPLPNHQVNRTHPGLPPHYAVLAGVSACLGSLLCISSDPTQPWKGVRTPFQSPDFGFRTGADRNRESQGVIREREK